MARIRVKLKIRLIRVCPVPNKKAFSGLMPILAALKTPAIAELVMRLIVKGVTTPEMIKRIGANRAILCFLNEIKATNEATK